MLSVMCLPALATQEYFIFAHNLACLLACLLPTTLTV